MKTFDEWFNESYRGSDCFDAYAVMFPNIEKLRGVTAWEIKTHVHELYSFYPVDTADRELVFDFVAEELGINYKAVYDAWMHEEVLV